MGGCASDGNSLDKDAPWELLYHQMPLKGPTEAIRIIFEVAGVPYQEKGGDEMYAMTAAFANNSALTPEHLQKDIMELPHAVFAPPFLKKGSFVLSQNAAIAEFLGHEFGMMPNSPTDRALAMQLNISCNDIMTEGHDAFHPVEHSGSYSNQKEEAKVAIAKFCEDGGRFDKWLKHFALFVNLRRAATGKPDGFLFDDGTSISYAEIRFYHTVDAMRNQFGDKFEFPYWKEPCRAKPVAVLEAFMATCETNPRLKAYVDSDRRKPWCGDSFA